MIDKYNKITIICEYQKKMNEKIYLKKKKLKTKKTNHKEDRKFEMVSGFWLSCCIVDCSMVTCGLCSHILEIVWKYGTKKKKKTFELYLRKNEKSGWDFSKMKKEYKERDIGR